MPLPSQSNGLPSVAGDLGLGDLLQEQVGTETNEQRKKRMLQMQQQQAGGSLSSFSLLGAGGLSGGA